MRPSMSAHPQVGSVMRERIFSRVLFPAPFLPISPTTSPCRISNDASRSAHMIESSPSSPAD